MASFYSVKPNLFYLYIISIYVYVYVYMYLYIYIYIYIYKYIYIYVYIYIFIYIFLSMTSPINFYHVIQIILYMGSCDHGFVTVAVLWERLS